MDKGDKADFFVPSNRRTGIDRREFNYSFHIPERRHRRERRRFPTVNILDGPEALKEEGVVSVKFPVKRKGAPLCFPRADTTIGLPPEREPPVPP